jgi:branched-chain amino acid transport system ATP-binding protein
MLSIENIDVTYHHTMQVLRDLSLTVPEGQIVALLGGNGAGKSTVLKAASNLLALENGALTAGRIRFCGRDTRTFAPDALVRAGLVHVREGRRIFAELTVEENLIAASQALNGRALAPELARVYSTFPKLDQRRRQVAGYLSGGEQQMLALGRAMLSRPRMMLMDEPSMGLAPQMVAEVYASIRRFNVEDGVTILLVEQNAAVALSVAHQAIVMERGRIVMEGAPEVLRNHPDIQEFYLGRSTEGGPSRSADLGDKVEGEGQQRALKHYSRRKRWLG